MSYARKKFLERMDGFLGALSNESIVDGAAHENRRNGAARIIRSGLIVIVFSAFEEFIRVRGKEALELLCGFRIPFSAFSDDFRKIVTIGAIDAIKQKMSIIGNSEDCIIFVQEEAKKIGSTADQSYRFSELLFGHTRANIQADEIEGFLKALRFAKPWESIGFLADRFGVGTVSPEFAVVGHISGGFGSA